MTDDRQPPPAEASGDPASDAPAEPATSLTPTDAPTLWPPVDEPAASPAPPPRLGIGSVLARTFDTFLAHPLPFVVLATPSALISVFAFQLFPDTGSPGWFGVTLLADIVGLIFGLAIIVAADQARSTSTVAVGPALSRALRRTIIAILSFVALILVVIGTSIAVGIVIGVVSLAHVGALTGIAALAGGILIAYVVIRWLLAQPAVVLDHAGPMASLNRSWALTRGNVLRMIGLGLIVGLITFPTAIGLGLLALTLTNPLLVILVGAAVALVTGPLAGILIATIYGDLTRRPIAPPTNEPNPTARWVFAGALIVAGIVGTTIALPNLGTAFARIATASIPAADRGTILFGTGRGSATDCRPTGTKTTFTTAEPIYIGGYFSRAIPAGQTAKVVISVNGTVSGSGPVGDLSRPAVCYYELDPLVGAQPATYRIEVTLGAETIARGEFVVQ